MPPTNAFFSNRSFRSADGEREHYIFQLQYTSNSINLGGFSIYRDQPVFGLFDTLSQVLVRQDFCRFNQKLQNHKISYCVITPNKFSVLPDFAIRHDISNFGNCKILKTFLSIIQSDVSRTMASSPWD